MRALILNGAAEGDAAVEFAGEVLSGELSGMGWDTEMVRLRELQLAPCAGDFWCWVRTPGMCFVDANARTLTEKVVRARLLVLLTRMTFGGYSSELKRGLDHLIGVMLPHFTKIGGEVRHEKRYERYPSLAALGVLRHLDQESERIFRTLVERNAINLHSPAHAVRFAYDLEGQDVLRECVHGLVAKAEVER